MMWQSATAQRRSGEWLTPGLLALLATIGVALAVAVLPAAALAGSSPVIESTSASNLTPTDATVGAEINPEGLPHGVYYQFQVVANTSEYLSEIACSENEIEPLEVDGCMGSRVPDALPIREVSGDTGKFVSLDLEKAAVTLQPGTTYHYRLLAVKALESEDTLRWEPPAVVAPDQTFTTPLESAPSIESESASAVTAVGATLEATIDSEDLPEGAYYQFQLVKSTSEYLSELACPERSVQLNSDDGCNSPDTGLQPTAGALPIGFVAKGPVGQSVSQSLAAAGITLQPGTTYHYRVLAVKRVQSEDGINWKGPPVAGPDRTLTTPVLPVIDSVSLSNLTSTDATLEAQIDTEGLATTYEFHMWSSCAHQRCEYIREIPLPSGLLLGSFQDQTVRLDLNSAGLTLNYGAEYGWGITATSEAGHISVSGGVFEPPPPSVIEPLNPGTSPLSGAGQPAGSNANSGDQPVGTGGSSSSSTPSLPSPGPKVPKTTKLEALTKAQKLAAALRACKREPRKKQTGCKKQARERYGTSGKKALEQAGKGKNKTRGLPPQNSTRPGTGSTGGG